MSAAPQVATQRDDGPADEVPPREFIAELHGLRGLALLMVVLFHLFGGGRVSGGIDVFLVISGFLFTGSLSRQAITTGSIDLPRHYGRTGFRLLPSALLVLVAVGLASVVLLPGNRWSGILSQILASVLFLENWQLIGAEMSYDAAGVAASPLQHFWSLSIQGQFFIVWPLVILAVVWWARRVGRKPLPTLLFFTLTMTIASFGYAAYLGASDQTVSYFHTGSRWWELGAGAVLGLTAHRLPGGSAARLTAGWAGLALILSSGAFWNGADLFPGPAALWPVVGALLILYGSGAAGRSANTVLSAPPLVFLADVSYPLYLWHWPVAVFALAWLRKDSLNLLEGGGVLVVAVFLAWGTQRWVADPSMRLVGRIRPRLAAWLVAGTVGLLALALLAGHGLLEARIASALTRGADSREHPGALVLAATFDGATSNFSEPFVPALEVAGRDRPVQHDAGCLQTKRDAAETGEVLVCDPVGAVVAPEKRIVVTGGSHGVQWLPALERIGVVENWSITVIAKEGCLFFGSGTLAAPDGVSSASCIAWNEKADQVIRDLAPDAVLTVGTRTDVHQVEGLYQPTVDKLREWGDAGIPVLAVRDSPRFAESVPECLVRTRDEAVCSKPRAAIFQRTNPLTAIDLPVSVVTLGEPDLFCLVDSCPPVIGNVLVYRDDDHFTVTYMRTMAAGLQADLRAKVPWLF